MANSKKEHKVTVLGEEIDEERFRRDHERGVVGGIFLIFIGTILLLNSMGVIPWQIWDTLLIFWPVLLILIGIQIVLGRGPLGRIVVLGLSVYVLGSIFLFAARTYMPEFFNSLPVELKNTIYIWEVIRK